LCPGLVIATLRPAGHCVDPKEANVTPEITVCP
jgi:hypothetical protein